MLRVGYPFTKHVQSTGVWLNRNGIRNFTKDTKEKGFSALDYSKTKQTFINRFVDSFPEFANLAGVKPVVANSCTSTVVLVSFQAFLEKNPPIQIPQGCLLKVIRIVDIPIPK